MTSIFDDAGRNVACTVVEAGPCVITQIKTDETDGYEAVQLGFDDAKTSNTSKPLMGHFAKSGSTPKKKLIEFRDFTIGKELGDTVRVDEVFAAGDKVNVVGVSKGKGTQGVVKRHGFAGVGDATHGQHNRLRAPGSVGASSYPSRVFKGMRMAGRTGNSRVKTKNLRIVRVFPEQNILLIKGAIPGHKGSVVIIEK